MEVQQPRTVERVWLARAIAVAVDLVQVTLLPITVEGVFSPVVDGLDLATAAVMTLLVGWHIAFIPGFLIKLFPVVDLAPTWTMAVLIATRGKTKQLTAAHDAPMPELTAEKSTGRWSGWYDGLTKPSWTPTPATIGLIWTILYPLIVFSFGWVFVQCIRGRLPAGVAIPFAVNLAANLSFTPILFRLRNLWLASLDILIVLGTLVWAVQAVWPFSHTIAAAQLPYLIWVCIATVLQLQITAMNRQ
jgi:translocator protein